MKISNNNIIIYIKLLPTYSKKVNQVLKNKILYSY